MFRILKRKVKEKRGEKKKDLENQVNVPSSVYPVIQWKVKTFNISKKKKK